MEWAIRPGQAVQLQIQIMEASGQTADGGARCGEDGQGLAQLQAGGQQDGGDRGPQHRGHGHDSGGDHEVHGTNGPVKEEVASDVGDSAKDLAPGKGKWSELPVTEEVVVLEDSQV